MALRGGSAFSANSSMLHLSRLCFAPFLLCLLCNVNSVEAMPVLLLGSEILGTENDLVSKELNSVDASVSTTKTHKCNKAAHFDAECEHCVCNDPTLDGLVRDPKKYGNYAEGDVCYDCTSTDKTRAIVFILDSTGTVGIAGWEAQKEFMLKVLELMKDVKAGVLVITEDPYIAVEMDDFKNNKDKIRDFVKNSRFQRAWTVIGVALYRARMMLEKVDADEKMIVICSDGDYDGCDSCSQSRKDNMKAHPQEVEAEAIHEAGINVVYIAVENTEAANDPDIPTRIEKIAGPNGKIIPIEDFAAFDESVLNGFVSTVCTVEIARDFTDIPLHI